VKKEKKSASEDQKKRGKDQEIWAKKGWKKKPA
jgi:hypothetical protein